MTRIRLRRMPPACGATIDLPCPAAEIAGDADGGGAVITVGAVGFSFSSALRKATSLAKRISDDPIMKSVLPPQASAAIATTRRLAAAAKKGKKTLKLAYSRLPSGMKKKMRGVANKMLKQAPKERAPDERFAEPLPDETPHYPEQDIPTGPEANAPEIAPVPDDPSAAVMPDDDNSDEYSDEYEGEQ
jgi:hypothetical protein